MLRLCAGTPSSLYTALLTQGKVHTAMVAGHTDRLAVSPMSLIGCNTPISLFTVIIETRDVVGRMAASKSF